MLADALVAAICQDPSIEDTQPVDIDIDFVLDACRNLVTVDHLSLCRFSHLSVEEYFEEQHPWIVRQAPEVVAKVYLSLLNDPTYWETPSWYQPTKRQISPLEQLLGFARSCWPEHVSASEATKDVRMLLRKFLGSLDSTSAAYRSWHRMYEQTPYTERYGSTLALNYHLLDPPDSPILPIVLFNFYYTMTEIMETGKLDPNIENNSGFSLLVLAIIDGNEEFVTLLLDAGADVNMASPKSCSSPLIEAVIGRNPSIVQLLISYGADVNMQVAGIYENAIAATMGTVEYDEQIFFLLLDNGADVNCSCGPMGSFLNILAFGGNIALLRRVFERYPPDICLPDGQGRTPLHMAARGGSVETFDYLVSLGLDYTAKDAKGDGVLHYAACATSQEMLERLLEDGYDLALWESPYWSPLHWACRSASTKMIEWLSGQMASSNNTVPSKVDPNWTPYAIAILYQNESMITGLSAKAKSMIGRQDGQSGSGYNILGSFQRGFKCDGCHLVGTTIL
jgi:ankyrin repeat protein